SGFKGSPESVSKSASRSPALSWCSRQRSASDPATAGSRGSGAFVPSVSGMALPGGALARPNPADPLQKYRSGSVRVDPTLGQVLGQAVLFDQQVADPAAEAFGHHALDLVEHPSPALLRQAAGGV